MPAAARPKLRDYQLTKMQIDGEGLKGFDSFRILRVERSVQCTGIFVSECHSTPCAGTFRGFFGTYGNRFSTLRTEGRIRFRTTPFIVRAIVRIGLGKQSTETADGADRIARGNSIGRCWPEGPRSDLLNR
jgi:hypothetical protein